MYHGVCVCVYCSMFHSVYRIPYHQDDIAKSLVKLISDCCQQDGALPKPKSPGIQLLAFTILILPNILESRLINGVIKCLIMLQRCSPSLKVSKCIVSILSTNSCGKFGKVKLLYHILSLQNLLLKVLSHCTIQCLIYYYIALF